jgi:hypothetical protein
MPLALSRPSIGALSSANRAKLTAALSRVNEGAVSGQGFGYNTPSVGPVTENPGLAVGPPESVSGYAKDFAASAGLGMLAGGGFGPLGALNMARTAINPSSFADTQLTNIPGLPNGIAFSPGPIGPLADMAGFGGLMRTAGALNRANLERIARTDPNASMVGGPGWGGAFSNGTYNGTLPGGLEASQRRGIIKDIAKQHYDRERNQDRRSGAGNGALGSASRGRAGEQGSNPRKDH